MSKVASIVDVLQGKIAIGEKVTIRGWVRTRRDSKAGLSFLAVYDGSCFDPIQAIVNNDIENYESEVLRLTTGCSVIVTGTIVESPAEGQAVELQAEKVEVTGFVEDPDTYPMAAKRHSIEYLREVAHLRPRTNIIGAVARVRHCLAQAIHRFFHEQGFYWLSCWIWSICATRRTCTPPSFPAGRSSASPSPARWRTSRGCCSPTRRPAPSTRMRRRPF